jgi:hypothetical protein
MKSYKYACELGLVDANSLSDTDMLSPISRIEVAQMLSEFAIKVFMKLPNSDIVCVFDDMKNNSPEDIKYAESVCQMGLMGLEFDGSPTKNFNPDGLISRAEFGTIFSRLLYGDKYNGDAEIWYRPHLNALKADAIMTKIDEPEMLEQRGYVMLMLQRADHSNFVAAHKSQALNGDSICSLSPYGEELEDAYIFACQEEITSAKTIEDAGIYSNLTREVLGKMVTVFSIHVL